VRRDPNARVDLAASSIFLGLDATSSPPGYATTPEPLPNTPALAGLVLHGQALWSWGGACSLRPFGLRTSNGLKVTVQF
jgi:hypothetical protein